MSKLIKKGLLALTIFGTLTLGACVTDGYYSGGGYSSYPYSRPYVYPSSSVYLRYSSPRYYRGYGRYYGGNRHYRGGNRYYSHRYHGRNRHYYNRPGYHGTRPSHRPGYHGTRPSHRPSHRGYSGGHRAHRGRR